jgi:hypothetical protein
MALTGWLEQFQKVQNKHSVSDMLVLLGLKMNNKKSKQQVTTGLVELLLFLHFSNSNCK